MPKSGLLYRRYLERVAEIEKFVKPIVLAANILYPSYQGKLFKENEEYNEMAAKFFQKNLNVSGLKVLAAYKEKTGVLFSFF